jgi:hypothetical protein
MMRGQSQTLWWAACVLVAGAIATGIVLAFTGSSKAAPTKAEYFARVAAICRVYGPKLDKISPPHDIAIPGEVAGPVSLALPLVVAETRELRALRPPEELAPQVEHWLALKDRAIVTLKRTLREALIPDVRRMGPDWLRFVDELEAAAHAGGKIGFPRICSTGSA